MLRLSMSFIWSHNHLVIVNNHLLILVKISCSSTMGTITAIIVPNGERSQKPENAHRPSTSTRTGNEQSNEADNDDIFHKRISFRQNPREKKKKKNKNWIKDTHLVCWREAPLFNLIYSILGNHLSIQLKEGMYGIKKEPTEGAEQSVQTEKRLVC